MQRTAPMAVLVAFCGLWLAGCGDQSSEPAATNADRDTPPKSTYDGGEASSNHSPAETSQTASAGVTLDVAGVEEYQDVLEQNRGKVVLVDFWATWCVPCREGFPHTVEMSREYADDGLAVVSVSMDDPDEGRQKALEFLQQQNAEFPNLLSRFGGSPESMEVFDIDGGSLPHYKIYDRDGTLVKKLGGDPFNPIDTTDVEAAVREALGLEAGA